MAGLFYTDAEDKGVRKNQGFTLIELMTVVTLVAILGALAYPSYKKSITKSTRSAAQGDLQAAAAAMARYRAANFTYVNATLGTGSTAIARATSPENGTVKYDIVFTGDAPTTATTNGTASTFTITAKPRSGTDQANTGALAINEKGETCWKESSDTGCTPGTDDGWK